MIVVVASFHAFPMPQNILGTIFLRLQLTLPTPQCMYHVLTKLCSQSVPNFYFAPITCCLAHTTKGVYHALFLILVLLYCQHPPRVSTSVL